MPNKQFTCDHCDADFKIKHSLDESYYEVMFCPFCGGEINEGDEDEVDEYE
jgi:PHP family Zn ribbon phosphoesterase